MIDEIVEVWWINNRVNLRLIEAISDEGMGSTLSKRGGRNVVRQFAHLHNNRIWQLQRRARALAEDAHLFETHDEPDRQTLTDALDDSAGRIERFIRLVAEGAPGARTFKRGLIAHVACFINHESHHRGNIVLTLKQCGHPLDSQVRDSIWDWDRI